MNCSTNFNAFSSKGELINKDVALWHTEDHFSAKSMEGCSVHMRLSKLLTGCRWVIGRLHLVASTIKNSGINADCILSVTAVIIIGLLGLSALYLLHTDGVILSSVVGAIIFLATKKKYSGKALF